MMLTAFVLSNCMMLQHTTNSKETTTQTTCHFPLNAFLHFNKKYIEMCIKNAFLRQKFQIYTCWQWGVLVY